MSILLSIENICLKAKKSKLNPLLIKKDVNKLNRYLGEENKLTLIESICFATILCKNLENERADLYELGEDFSISPIYSSSKILPSIESLLEKGLIIKTISKRGNGILRQKYYSIEPNVLNAIILQESMPERVKTVWDSSISILCEISHISLNLLDSKKNDVYETINNLIEDPEASKFSFIKWIKDETKLKDENLILFCHVVYQTLNGMTSVEFKEFSQILFKKQLGHILFVQNLINGSSPLIEKDLIKIHKAIFLDEMELQLTPKTIAALSEEKLIVANQDQHIYKGLILPENIPKQVLFYNSDVEEKISKLHQLLEPIKYDELMGRLNIMEMRQGLTIIFYGGPGTGKTELCKQLAVNSNRAIMNVDLSSIKGSYFGETERRLKKIFTDYEKLVKSANGQVPILLLNEADGLLRNRAEINTTSTVASTEHMMQTILLQNIEDTTGIIIATTNFISSLDPAFDRRFLFKLELNKPSLMVRSKIVQNKIQHLTEGQADELAVNYEVTGGQIENVEKKCAFFYILNGEVAPYSMIESFFEEEISLQKKINKIGF